MISPAKPRWDQEIVLAARLAAFVSFFSFLFFLRHGEVLLYGDAVAHINIARRVFDSRTPGLLQLGTVWLPLPHLLMIPFLLSDRMWQSGVGGSIPSMLAYVFGVVGIFRLVRGALSLHDKPDVPIRIAAWMASLIYAANPNLIYLQSTAMTESLYVALFIWAVVYFNEFVGREQTRSLIKCGLCLAGACLTRYDGWFLAAVMGVAAVIVRLRAASGGREMRGTMVKFLLLAVAAPILWLAYNAIVYRNPLEFADGPYSARAIERKAAVPGAPAHPGDGDLRVAASYFLKAAELNMVESNWNRVWLALLFIGTGALFVMPRKLWPLLLLWAPVPFYALSVAYSGVPIFLPPWWPFSIYNARYGIELLPAFAVFSSLTVYFAAGWLRPLAARIAVAGALVAFAGFGYASVWRAQPISLREADVNSRDRIPLEKELANFLQELPANSTLLMYLGAHVGTLQQAGIPLRRVINEGNHRTWKQPFDSEGLWERALANPGQNADFVVAFAGDPVDQEVQRQNLSSIAVIHASGEPDCTVYVAHRGKKP
jgi:hypothetical protein